MTKFSNPQPTDIFSRQTAPTSLLLQEQREMSKREVVTGAPAAAPTNGISQLSPVTTYNEGGMVNGVYEQETVTYTQIFSSIPQQWPSAQEGSIGLGDIKGTVGKTSTTEKKRDVVPTNMPKRMYGKSDEGPIAKLARRENGAEKTSGAGWTNQTLMVILLVALVCGVIA